MRLPRPPVARAASRRFLSEGWQSSLVSHDPKISSRSHGEIEKLAPPTREGAPAAARRRRAVPSTHTRFPLYDAPRFRRETSGTEREIVRERTNANEYSLGGFITFICARVSNLYPGRSVGTIEPTLYRRLFRDRNRSGRTSLLKVAVTLSNLARFLVFLHVALYSYGESREIRPHAFSRARPFAFDLRGVVAN